MIAAGTLPRRSLPFGGLRPDAGSPGDWLRLAKGRASGPARSALGAR